ncbi:MAG: type IV pilus assembly protein PilM [Candidatus Vogelbacteria bacterium]|nr:type IV pilus assembly protein PilM [Candidatus Vogelbacteria bacterium]
MDNPLSKLFTLGSLFSKGDTSVVGLDIGSSSIKVVQLRKDKGQMILETYGELSAGPYGGASVGQAVNLSPAKTAELIKDLFRESAITTKVGGLSIPLKSSLLVAIEVPESVNNNLDQIIPIEARKYVPVPISEVALDWWVIPKSTTENLDDVDRERKGGALAMTNVLVVAVHKDTIKQFQDISTAVGVETKFLEIETFSAMRSSLQNDLGATVIVDLGAASTKVVIIDYGVVRLSHTISKGSQDVTHAIARSLNIPFIKAEEIKRRIGLVEKVDGGSLTATLSPIVEYIFSEVTRVMVNYQKKYNRSVDKVILIGGGASLKGIKEIASQHVYAPIVFGNPFERVQAPAFLSPVLSEVGPSFAVAIGVAMRALQES